MNRQLCAHDKGGNPMMPRTISDVRRAPDAGQQSGTVTGALQPPCLPPTASLCACLSILVFTCRLTTELRLVRWTTHPTAGPTCCESRHQRYWMRDTNNTNTYTSRTPVKQFNTHLYTCPRGHLTVVRSPTESPVWLEDMAGRRRMWGGVCSSAEGFERSTTSQARPAG